MTKGEAQDISDLNTLFGVEGLVAVVTGGATGIGLMIATALETNGAIVYIVGRRMDALNKAVNERSRRGNLIPIQADVTDRDQVKDVVEAIKARHGFINLLVNNAGIARNQLPQPMPKPENANGDITKLQEVLWDAGPPGDFDASFKVNTTAVYFTTVAFLELLHEGNMRGNRGDIWSQVITVSSIVSFRKDDGIYGFSYMLSKAAATHLGKTFAHFFRDWRIRSNVIAPGYFPSEMTASMSVEKIMEMVPIARWGDLDDIGGLVLFLASKAGSYVDGVTHLVDGGRLTLFPSTY